YGDHREELAELHEDRAERFQREAQALGARARSVDPEVRDRERQAQEARSAAGQELVQPVAADRVEDARAAQGSHGPRDSTARDRRDYFASLSRFANFRRNLATFGSITNVQ